MKFGLKEISKILKFGGDMLSSSEDEPNKEGKSASPNQKKISKANTAITESKKDTVALSDSMSDEDEKKFAEKQKKELASISSLKNPMDVLNAITKISEQANETIKFCEIQKTKRAQIRAAADVEIRRIDAISDMVRQYLDRSFDERKELFDRQFLLVDKALASGDRELLAMSLQSINQLANQSSFKALSDIAQTRKMLLDKNTELDI